MYHQVKDIYKMFLCWQLYKDNKGNWKFIYDREYLMIIDTHWGYFDYLT